MPTIDVQVHAYERNHPGRPWAAVLHGPPEVTGDQMVAAMDAVGVDGAILVSPFTMYRYDASYALEVHTKHPGRFGADQAGRPVRPAVAETIADWAKTPGTVGIRIMMNRDVPRTPPTRRQPGAGRGRATRPAGQILSWGRLEQAGPLAARNPDTRSWSIISGLQQPFEPPRRRAVGRSAEAAGARRAPQRRDQDHRGLHALAEAVSLQGHLGPAGRIFDAFGLDRCMWGTDWTRAVGRADVQGRGRAFRAPTACPTATAPR